MWNSCRFRGVLAGFAGVSLLSHANGVQGAAISWDAGGGANLNWTTLTNWSDDADPSGDDITFNDIGGVLTAGTVTNIVDASFAINSLAFTNVGTASHTTQISSGQTLTLSGTGSVFQLNTGTATATSSTVGITGAGTFAITGGTTANFNVGATAFTAQSTPAAIQTLDLSGLATLTADVGNFAVGTGQRNAGAVTFGGTSTVTATALTLGGNTTTGGAQSSLSLGQTNTINANTISVGNGRSSGVLQFRTTGLSNPTITIANRAGTGAANVNVGLLDTNASVGATGTLDFSGGTLTGTFGTINLGRGGNSSATGSSTGNFVFGAGSMTATAINAGIGNNGTSVTSTGIGNVTMTASAGTLTATTVTVGTQTAGNTNSATGTFTQNGGTAAITTLNLVNRTATGTANVSGTYELAGGTLKAGAIQAGSSGSGTGTVTRAFNWTGGTIQNLDASTDLTIGSGLTLNANGANAKNFNVDAGRTITVNANVTAATTLAKNGGGTLTLAGANTYAAGIAFNAGFLNFSTNAHNLNAALTVPNDGGLGVKAAVAGSTLLTTSGLTLGTGGTTALAFDFNGLNTTAPLINTGAFTANGTINVGLQNGAVLSSAAHALIDYTSFSGTGTFPAGSFTLGARSTGTIVNDLANTVLNLVVAADTPKWTGLDSGNWVVGTTGPNKNWRLTTAGTATDYIEGDVVLFDDTATGTTDVVINTATVSPSATTFNNSTKTYTVSSTGGFGIAGIGGLTKNGAGGVTISTANAYTGGTTMNNGTLTLSGNNTFGTGGVSVNGGTLTLSGSNTYTGTTTLAGGKLNVNNAAALGSGAIAISGGTLDNASGGAITLASSPVQSWNGDFVFAGSSDLNIGSGTVTLGGAGSRTVTVNAGTLSVGALTSATQGITKAGAGTLQLNPAIASIIGGPLTVSAGTFGIGAQNLTAAGLSGNGAVINGSATNRVLNVNAGATNTFGGTLSNGGAGTLGVNKLGSSSLALNGSNSYTGGTTVSLGTLLLGDSNALGTGALTYALVTSGAETQSVLTSGPVAIANAITVNGGATKTLGGGTANASSFIGNITVATGGFQVSQVNGGTLTLSGTMTNSGASRAITFVNDGAVNVSGGIGGALVVNQSGVGTTTLSGANSYTGATNVTSGTLAIGSNASLPSVSAVTVGGGSGTATIKIGAFTQNLTTLNFASNGRFDVGTGILLVNNGGGATALAAAKDLVVSGYNGGLSNGPGYITSAADAKHGVGYGDTGTATKVRYTLYGDGDLDGGVSINDFNSLAANFGRATGKFWVDGDYDYDGGVSINDFNLLAANFGQTVASVSDVPNYTALALWDFAVAHNDVAGFVAATGVPEPASLASVAVGAFGLLSRRRRRAS